MAHLELATIDHLLTTTRSVRRRLDLARPVDPGIIERCIEIAVQAPSGGNVQGWHFVVVADAAKRRRLATLYGRAAAALVQTYSPNMFPPEDPRAAQLPRMIASGEHLTAHLHEVPLLVVPCLEGRFETAGLFVQASLYGSILPAVWSFMLALRARGIGAAWTTDHLMYEREAAEILGIPSTITQVALLPVAYFTGTDFKPANRLPAGERTHWDTWGMRRSGASRTTGHSS
jgi:nitroreductase